MAIKIKDVTKSAIKAGDIIKEPLYGTVRVVDIINDGEYSVAVFFNKKTGRYGACEFATFLYGALIQQESDHDKAISKPQRDKVYKLNGYDGYPF